MFNVPVMRFSVQRTFQSYCTGLVMDADQRSAGIIGHYLVYNTTKVATVVVRSNYSVDHVARLQVFTELYSVL